MHRRQSDIPRSHTNTSRYSMITGRYPTSAPAAAPLDCHCAQIIPFSATCASHPPRGSHPPVQSALRPSSARSSQVAKARTNPPPTQPPPTHVRPPLGEGADYASSHRPRRGASQPRPAPITAPAPSRPSRRLSVLGGASQHTAPITAPDDAAPDEPCLTTTRLTPPRMTPPCLTTSLRAHLTWPWPCLWLWPRPPRQRPF